MKKIIAFIFLTGIISAQSFTVKNVTGEVRYQKGGEENWVQLQKGTVVENDATILTGKKSNVKLRDMDTEFTLGESSAVSVSSIKKMRIDDLLLALAMEDMMNAPKKPNKSSDNTAVYGTKQGEEVSPQLRPNDFGLKRLNGAKQLAENGMEESSVVAARETYRKYPDTKKLASYRIYFADILYKKGLYEEALKEYYEISKLELSKEEKDKVDAKVEAIKTILVNK